MSTVFPFTFNDFQENTYVIHDQQGVAFVIDPGCYYPYEEQEILSYLTTQKLQVQAIINTHCHLDHVFGNHFLKSHFPHASLLIPEGELPFLQNLMQIAAFYGLQHVVPSPPPDDYLATSGTISFGSTTLQLLFTPGHSPASVSLYNDADGYVIAGDVLFYDSIGRTDLPGGNHQTLLRSIEQHMLTLSDETTVYSGHGPVTQIGRERRYNPFLRGV